MTDERSVHGGVEQRQHARAPIEAEVRISYPDRERLVAELCRNVSVGGMFVASDAAPAVGTVVRFELDLAVLKGLLRGTGEVAWVRSEPAGKDAPAGFGVRFVDLDAHQRQLIFRIVDRYIQRGGEPFDLDGPA